MMPFHQTLITMVALIAGTLITRFLPFLIFPQNRKTPSFILYLGRVLPYAVMGLLVVFCLKEVSVLAYPYGIPEAIAIASIAIFHIWKNNVLISIAVGTLVYMALVQHVFV